MKKKVMLFLMAIMMSFSAMCYAPAETIRKLPLLWIRP